MLKRLFKKNYLIRLFKRIQDHDSLGFSAQLAYFFLLSLFPLLITIFSLIPFLPLNEEDILTFIEDFAPGETMHFIHQNLEVLLANHNGGLLSFGIIATLWSASNGMNAIIKAVNRAYEIEENRPFFIVRGISVLFTIVMVFIFIVALLLPVFGEEIGVFLFSKFGLGDEFIKIWNGLRWGVSSIILFIVFAAIYMITPNRKLKCITVLPGAFFSVIGWIAASWGFSFYVSNFGNYSLMYGSLGGIIVMMIWFYLTASVLIVGGEINGFNEAIKSDNCD